MSTTSPYLLLTFLETGENDATWGPTANTNWTRLEEKLCKHNSFDISAASKTLSDDEERCAVITLTGALAANRTVQFTGREGTWIVINDTTEAFTAKLVLAGPTTGVDILQGSGAIVYCDGTDMRKAEVGITAADFSVVPAGNIASTDVQDAIEELDSEKQPIEATLTALAGLTTAADKLLYSTGADALATTDLTAFGRTLLDDANAAAARATLELQDLAVLDTVGTAQIDNDSITNAKLANAATQTIKGRTTASTGDPEDLTATQVTAMLNTFVGDSGSGGTKGLVPAPSAGSADLFLKASATYGTIPVTAVQDVQTFNSSGTWTKPAGGVWAYIECWGGGGSGGAGESGTRVGGGGGGGAYVFRKMLVADLAGTVAVTIGDGGAARTGTSEAGEDGGNTTFGTHVTAYGGGGGAISAVLGGGGGSGGGWLSAGGGTSSPGEPRLKSEFSSVSSGHALGGIFGGGSTGVDSGGSSVINGGDSAYGGGGGGTVGEAASGGGSSGGWSIYGGGGGGGGATGGTDSSGGTSLYGGNGGGGRDSGNAVAGSQPGGGGGGSYTGDSGAGGKGKCIVTVTN